MTFYKTIVCLANSRKRGKRCIAGKEIVHNQLTQNWIRPVSSHGSGELSETEVMLKQGKGPKLLDVVTIPIERQQAHAYQTENYLIDSDQRWIENPPLPISLLPSLSDSVDTIWINGYHSSRGNNDRIPLEYMTNGLDSSLLLIKPDFLTIRVSTQYRSKVRAYFGYKNQEYNFSISDLAVELHYETKPNGEYPITDDAYLCISLSEPFEGNCYKLVAGIIFVKMKEIYTIGHSNHTIDRFIDLLKKHRITALADVRSHPYSKHFPQFSYEALKQALKNHHLAYVFLGKELGARTTDPNCYDSEARVQYACLAKTATFQEGLLRLNKGMESYRIALMCAEKDPLMCHRTLLICRHLRTQDIRIKHILEDGGLETQQEVEQRLLEIFNLSKQDLFARPEQLIEQAYDRQSENIAYQKDE
jgi:hypothetical protein